MSNRNMEEELKKSVGLLEGLNQMAEDIEQEEIDDITINTNTIEKSSIESIFTPTVKIKYIAKGFTLRDDQIKRIERYSKKAKKNESEFIRDLLDYVFTVIEKG